jgi:hypothetical protein
LPKATASDIYLISNSGYVDLSGNYHVVGEVKNIGATSFKFVNSGFL